MRQEILEALDTRDGARLAEILKRHLRNKCETVKTALKEFEDTAADRTDRPLPLMGEG